MIELFGHIVVKKEEFPHFVKANKLMRKLSEEEIDSLLTGLKHLQRFPRRTKLSVVASEGCQANTEQEGV